MPVAAALFRSNAPRGNPALIGGQPAVCYLKRCALSAPRLARFIHFNRGIAPLAGRDA